MTIPAPSYTPQYSSIDPNDQHKLMQLELNLRKFEEDRRRFELERLRFIQQKRELDRMRLARFEKYKTEVRGHEPHLLAPHDSFKGANRPDSPMPKKHRVKAPSKLKAKKPIDYESSTVDETSDLLDSDEDQLNGGRVKRKDSFQDSVGTEIDERKHGDRLEPGLELQVKRRSSSSRLRSSSKSRHSTELQIASAPTSPNPELVLTPAPDASPTPVAPDAELQPETNKDVAGKVDEATKAKSDDEFKDVEEDVTPRKGFKANIKPFIRDARITWRQLKQARPKEWKQIRVQARRCFSYFFMMTIFIGVGGLLFRYLEGNFEDLYKCNTKRISRNFIDQMWLASHRLRWVKC